MPKFIFILWICFLTLAYGAEPCAEKWNYIKSSYIIPEKYKDLEGLCGSEFRNELAHIISTNKDLGYNTARKIMFSDLDNHNGEVCDVYTSYCMETEGIPPANLMNCEHTWPQSQGAVGLAKSDLNHLFPVESKVNSRRNNNPFCEVATSTWDQDGSYLGKSEFGTKCFEPRNEHKGAVARALMYFSIRYDLNIDEEQETFIRKWNDQYPPTPEDVDRNNRIEEIQNNRNPFIDAPYFAEIVEDF